MIEQDTARQISIAAPEVAATRYRTLPATQYDLVIIGGGSAGLPAAGLARTLGAHVALLDREGLGGECLNTGCVPSKALLHVARLAADIRRAETLGLRARLEPAELSAVADRVQRAIAEVYAESDAPEHYLAQGIDVAFGAIQFTSPSTLTINGQSITAKRFLLCMGSHPAVAPTPGLSEAGYLTNETVFQLRRLPARLLVIGGGPIGVELGQAFARLGSAVTIVQRGARLLPKDEPEASELLMHALTKEGITILTRTTAQSVAVRDGLKVATLSGAESAEGTFEVAADEILVATGRAPNVEGLALERAGVAFDVRRGVRVDAHLRTTSRRIYAAGDITGGPYFTHAAAKEALVAVRNALLPAIAHARLDERVMPWATFTQPEVAHVGLTEAAARERYGNAARVYTQPYRAIDRALTDAAPAGFIKLIAGKKGKLLGAQIVGADAGELINELALALERGLTLGQIAGATHVYPTLALGIQQAAGKYSFERTAQSGIVRLLRKLAW